MPRRYDDGEVSLPVGRNPEDLDWVAFAWELQSVETWDGEHQFVQFILGPSALVKRSGSSDLFTMGKPGDQHMVSLHPGMHSTMLDHANNLTRRYLEEKSYTMFQSPYAVDFIQGRLYKRFKSLPKDRTFDGHTVYTLGDVMEHGDDRAMQMVFDAVNFNRPRT